MKGILLAGGAGTRLDPITRVASKQLQPVYDKPMVYYPLSTLMLGGIREFLVISTPHDLPRFEALLGDGRQWGIDIAYEFQPEPNGIAQAFIIGESFIDGDHVSLILGDNIFYGALGIETTIAEFTEGALVFGYPVRDSERYGVVAFNADGSVVSLEEKPVRPKSNFAVPGLYLYDETVVDRTKNLTPSERGELEITDLNNAYLADNQLRVKRWGRGIAWLDSGTHDSLLESANFIATVERRQSVKIACLEEIALEMGFVSPEQMSSHVATMPNSTYRTYVESVLAEYA